MTIRPSNEAEEEAEEGDGQGRGVLHGDVHLISNDGVNTLHLLSYCILIDKKRQKYL